MLLVPGLVGARLQLRRAVGPHGCILENGMKSFKEATDSLLKLFMSYSICHQLVQTCLSRGRALPPQAPDAP